MPSIKKRIGYLPSPNIQEIIIKIATKEKLSQSKVVGKLVEEALIARDLIDHQNTNNLMSQQLKTITNDIGDSSLKYNELDELISDQGITYNQQKYKTKKEYISSVSREPYSVEMFELFREFILFQKMLKGKK